MQPVVDTRETGNQMQDIVSVVRVLRDAKASLEKQLSELEAHALAQGKRLTKLLNKSRLDFENVAQFIRGCADGIDTKTAASIQELPDAAMAKVLPAGLRNVLHVDYGSHEHIGEAMEAEIALSRVGTSAAAKEFARMAEATKGLIWDVERLSVIIQAYESDIMTLKEETSEVKAALNANRLIWRKKFSAVRRWQDYVRRAEVLKFQERLDTLADEIDDHTAATNAEIEAIMEMIGAQRARDNRVKLTLFLKKMKHSALYSLWRGWKHHHTMIQEEKYGRAMAQLMAEEAAKLAAMKKREQDAMLRCFIKRWQNRKIAVPFMTWADIIYAKRLARQEEELARQRSLLAGQMALLGDSVIGQKLKLYFAKMAGKMKSLTFTALNKQAMVGRMSRQLEGEKFKKLKAFLQAKMKGIKYATFAALAQEARDIKMRRLLNNEKAVKVGAFIAGLMKGKIWSLFNAFQRHATMKKAERAEIERLKALLAMNDSASMQRLKIFLSGKEKRLKFMAFSWWVKTKATTALAKMEDELSAKIRARKAMEEKLKAAQGQLGGFSVGRLDEEQAKLDAAAKKAAAMAAELERERQLFKQLEDKRNMEMEASDRDQADIKKAELDLVRIQKDKAALSTELNLMIEQIAFLNEGSKARR